MYVFRTIWTKFYVVLYYYLFIYLLYLFSYFVNIWLVSKHIGYSWQRQLLDITPVLTASLSAAALAYATGILCTLPLYTDGLLKLVVFVALYFAWSVLFRPKAYQYFRVAAKPLVKKIKRKKNKAKGIK